MSFIASQKDATVTRIDAPRSSPLGPSLGSLQPEEIDHFNLNSFPLLLPEESYATVFSVSKTVGVPLRLVGSPVMKWCSYMGEHGLVTGGEVVLTSNGQTNQTNQNNQQQGLGLGQGQDNDDIIYIDCISSPSSVARGSEFDIVLRITNNKNKDVTLQLVCRDMVTSSYNSTSESELSGPGSRRDSIDERGGSQLLVTGASRRNIGSIKAGAHLDLTVSVCAVDNGLQELRGVAVVDVITLKEYVSTNLMQVMVMHGPRD